MTAAPFRPAATLRPGDNVAVHFEMTSPFSVELRSEIRKAMEGASFYAPTGWWVRCGVIAAGTLLSEWVWATTGSLWAMGPVALALS